MKLLEGGFNMFCIPGATENAVSGNEESGQSEERNHAAIIAARMRERDDRDGLYYSSAQSLSGTRYSISLHSPESLPRMHIQCHWCELLYGLYVVYAERNCIPVPAT